MQRLQQIGRTTLYDAPRRVGNHLGEGTLFSRMRRCLIAPLPEQCSERRSAGRGADEADATGGKSAATTPADRPQPRPTAAP
ncbi:hypothetical protein NJ76_09780 [Rhodococcus sp. IITR03]|nr:hypothetical protein NJ76_09780 [Rhodococcus sp. IITR03]